MARAKKAAPPKNRNRTQYWRGLDAAHHIHPFTQTEALNREGVRVITKGKGIYLWDSDGKKLIDGMAGLWCVQLGYGNKELARAGCEALNTLPYYNHFFKTTNPWTAELAGTLTKLLPDGHQHVLFANSGSEGNDTALKMIRYYWNLKGRTEKKLHLSRAMSYHGVTMAGASLSGLTPLHPQFDLLGALRDCQRLRRAAATQQARSQQEREDRRLSRLSRLRLPSLTQAFQFGGQPFVLLTCSGDLRSQLPFALLLMRLRRSKLRAQQRPFEQQPSPACDH